VLVSDFDFELPPELIAQQPPNQRGGSRMLALGRETGAWRDLRFADLPQLLREGDVLVLNDSRVIPARLFGTRLVKGPPGSPQPTTGKVELLLTEQVSDWEWYALARPARRLAVGHELTFPAPAGEQILHATVVADGDFGERLLRFTPVDDFFARLEVLGHVPLPPYIHRPKQLPDEPLDRERYQTVCASTRLRRRAHRGAAFHP